MRKNEAASGGTARSLRLLCGDYAVCRLDPGLAFPEWAGRAKGFLSVCRTEGELSIVAASEAVPEGVKAERGWRILELEGPIPFSETGVLSRLLAPLAEAGIGIFAVSTYDTDYLLVKSADLDRGLSVLSGRYRINTAG